MTNKSYRPGYLGGLTQVHAEYNFLQQKVSYLQSKPSLGNNSSHQSVSVGSERGKFRIAVVVSEEAAVGLGEHKHRSVSMSLNCQSDLDPLMYGVRDFRDLNLWIKLAIGQEAFV